jgi:tetratricopeptide (TPR) repeat protein
VQTRVPAQPPEPAPEPEVFAQPAAPAKPAAAPVQTRVPAQPPEPAPEPEVFAQTTAPGESGEPDTTQSFFDLRSALATDAAPEQKSVPAQPIETDFEPEIFAQPSAPAKPEAPDATARSFFDLQSALATDASLGLDYDSSSEGLLNSDKESSLFSVLNVVKDIAEQDPRQDTPLFHFNLGTAYMECGDYEQAVDEFLSALYGTSDKIGCYVRLAECSLKLQRRELACGFLREALDNPDISPEQDRNARKLLNEISAS